MPTALFRARVSEDGKTVFVAPGVEVPMASCDMVAPEAESYRSASALLLYFHNDEDRQDFIETFEDAYSPESAGAVALCQE